MLHWAYRQWLSEPGRAILVAIVFAGVIALSLHFEGLRAGILGDLRDFSASLPADLVALEKGHTRFIFTKSNLAQLSRDRAETEIPGLEAHPIVLVPFILREHGFQSPAMLIGFDTLGGPQRVAEGRVPTAEPEIVIDKNLAKLQGLGLGNTIALFDSKLTIVGLSEGTTSPFMPYAFITYDRLLDVMLESDLTFGTDDSSLVAALLIRIPEGTDISIVRPQLEAALPEADLFTPAELAATDRAFSSRLLGSILTLVSVIAWIIALLTMAMLRFADVHRNLRQYGIQKALGAGPWKLALALAAGGLLVAVSALPLALVFAHVLAVVTSTWNPLYNARAWDLNVLIIGLAVAIVASIAGSFISLHRIVMLDPVIVFQR